MVSKSSGPKVGVIADSSLQRHIVCKALQSFGYEIAATYSPERVDNQTLAKADMDVWLVDLEDEDRWLDFISDLLEMADVPILFGDGKAPNVTSPRYPSWERKIYSKVKELVGQPILARESLTPDALNEKPQTYARIPLPTEFATAARNGTGAPAEYVWVLGASLGGPAAVKTFLDALPDGLPLAFILAQHIDAGFQKVLAQVLGRHNQFNFVEVVQGYRLRHSDILIAPVEHVVSIDRDARIRFHKEEWEGPYSPSIDQVMDLTVDALGPRTGAILFSGMGNDGAIAGQKMKRLNVPVWAQTADTCASSSMPDSARAVGCVTFSGSPRDLALQLTQHARQNFTFTSISSS